MPVTKYDLAILANNYFIVNAVSPRHPVTPDACANFAYNCYSIILDIPNDATAKRRLLNYMLSAADYYGIDVKKAIQYLNDIPAVQQMFFQFIKDNYGIEGNADIIKRLIGDAFSYIGEAAAGAFWSLIKPLIPIGIFVLFAIYATNQATRKRA